MVHPPPAEEGRGGKSGAARADGRPAVVRAGRCGCGPVGVPARRPGHGAVCGGDPPSPGAHHSFRGRPRWPGRASGGRSDGWWTACRPCTSTYLRPDAVHTGLVAAVAWIDPKLVRAVQYAGAVEPGGTGWAHQLPIALSAARSCSPPSTPASGWRTRRAATTTPAAMPGHAPGAATLWITADGTPNVGEWGRDVSAATPGVVDGPPEPRSDRRRRPARAWSAVQRPGPVGLHRWQ